ncbi:hypothetical protein BKA82DRAFT_714343 [Pisolithus tinctorius]|uniref:Uncharacterized protein n=1 Tax=Pisolithus tinctorius Marx 270 TaxID=870435 RepID=A0A0C3NMM9_PISTI|nr:hypothetical protein BKA82DRAFT_714343 [Pisolithus tinctorius]KIO02160.1 hypothetical protein M404DRAFT_714343 [Pisolithus tinctorius Marx 270]
MSSHLPIPSPGSESESASKVHKNALQALGAGALKKSSLRLNAALKAALPVAVIGGGGVGTARIRCRHGRLAFRARRRAT